MTKATAPTPIRFRNDATRWGLIVVMLHWVSALAVVMLFTLGLWMTSLTYYDAWYARAPSLHKSVGVIVFVVITVRLVWRLTNRTPDSIETHQAWETKIARAVHWVLYTGLFAVLISGYLISTADGRTISVFGLIEVPATLAGIEKQADIAGFIHLWLSVGLMSIVSIHALGALKHHFLDQDATLKRMLGRA